MATAEEPDQNAAAAAAASASASMSRKEKRKVAKKEKRKQKRKEVAEIERQEEEALLNDPEEQRRIQLEMEMEKERSEKERREFEVRERIFLEELERKKAEDEEEERKRALEEEERLKEHQADHDAKSNESDGEWEYVEEGPPEIIWKGNEIIVKKNRVKVKKSAYQEIAIENPNRPTSNPQPPQSEAFTDHKNTSALTAQQILENVAQQTPNFGTEQDKAHCPFHLKTGACRFGSRCCRVHFYPDKSCTLLMKNMYNGPGLAWEQDEGLEHTDEEVEHSYEEFYEDVHTEFLKYGEIINFKVCRNSSFHLRGNVYVHYKSVDSALLAYQTINGRYFAGKQVTCEFVSVTRWRVAICGDYMKSRLKICSRGTACNFIHSFRNPCGDYDWADWDKPPPRFWAEKMAALFGYSDERLYDKHSEEETVRTHRNSSKRLEDDRKRHHHLRAHSKEFDDSKRRSRDHVEENETRRTKKDQQTHISEDRNRTWDIVHKPDEVKNSIKKDDHHKPDEVKYSKKRDYRHDEYDENSEHNSRQQETSSGRMDAFGSQKKRKSGSDDKSRWRRSNDSDSESNLSDEITAKSNHLYKRSSRHVIEDDSWKSSNHNDKYPRKDSDLVESKFKIETATSPPREKKLHNTKNTSKVEFRDEHLKSADRRYEDRKSRNREEYFERSKSYDSSDCSRDSSALESDKRKNGSHDCMESLERIETSSDRWVPDNIHTREGDKCRRSSDHSYRKRESKDLVSYDWSAESSKSRGRSKSKEGRSKESNATEAEDTGRKHKERSEHGRSHKRKSHRSDNKRENNKDGSHDSSSESYDTCFKESISRSSSKSREGRFRASSLSSERKRKTSSTHT